MNPSLPSLPPQPQASNNASPRCPSGSHGHSHRRRNSEYIDAQKPGIEGKLTEIDRNDVNIALENLIDGVNSVKQFSSKFELQSNVVDDRIKSLKDKVIGKIHIVNNRITFQQLLPPAAAAAGGTLGVTATQVAIQSSLMGGMGALVVGGINKLLSTINS